jgi:hypothetical protein
VLYSRQTIMLLMRLCKLLSGEFGIRLHLDDPELVSKINKLVASGANPETLAVWREVRGQMALDGPEAAEVVSAPVHRGQGVAESGRQPEAAPPPEIRPKSVRIYRGQIVT